MTTNSAFKSPFVLSAVLPPDARAMLARAAQEANRITDELMREVHMEAAIRRVKLTYPQYFKE